MGKKILGLKIGAPENIDGKITSGAISWAIIDQNEDLELSLTQDQVLMKGRQLIGSHMKDIREGKGISLSQAASIAKCTIDEVKNFESGGAYSMDLFLKMTNAIDCYFYLQPRNGNSGDLEDLKQKS